MILSFCREGDTCGPEVVFCGLSSARPHRARQSSRVDWPLIRQGKRVCQFLKLLSGNKKIFWGFFLSCFYWSSNKSRHLFQSWELSVWFLNLWDSDFCFSKVEWNARCSVWAAYNFFSPSTFLLSLQVHHPNANSFTPWTDFLFPLWNHLFLLW